jgi:hypothetical protein
MSFLEPWCNFGSPVHRREGMKQTVRSFVGMDVHKDVKS